MNKHEKLVSIYACFLNDGAKLSVEILSPIWNGSHEGWHSRVIAAAGILERITMWSSEYIVGLRTDKFLNYFKENIKTLSEDSRYTGNVKIQEYVEKYKRMVEKVEYEDLPAMTYTED